MPTLANGKICYLETPTIDVQRSAEFYEKVFDWSIRQRGDGSTAFDDTVTEVRHLGTRPTGSNTTRPLDIHNGRQRS